MRKSFILFLVSLLVFVLQAGAQSDNTPPAVENLQDELVLSDPLSGNRYYKAIPFSLKKGEAVLFTMKSSAFKPNIQLSTNQATIRMGNPNESGTESKATFFAPADTSFFVIFTSMEENKTGKFSYGYKLLKAEQVIAINNAKKNPIDRFTTGNLGKQLLELLKHAETKFESIKGEKNLKESVTNEFMKTVVYEPNYQLEGAVKNRIEDFDRKRYYQATYSENANEEAATSLFDDLFTKIKSGLGDTFKYEKEEPASSDGTKSFKISSKKESTHYIRFILNVKEELSMEKDESGYLSTKTKKKWGVKILVF